jgi:hypothetical protein
MCTPADVRTSGLCVSEEERESSARDASVNGPFAFITPRAYGELCAHCRVRHGGADQSTAEAER